MKTKTFLLACTAALMAACSTTQKQVAVEVPASSIDVEKLINGIDYTMDVTGLSLADVRVLRNAPAALKGYPFKDAYLRGVYNGTTWYDSLTWKFDDAINYEGVEEREDESWRDHYFRAAETGGLLKYTSEEQNFMKRLKEREDELLKHNFDVNEPLMVNMQNLTNPTQLKTFDSLLCQQLAHKGFAIVPARHEQLFYVYEQNDYQSFPSFVTTDLFLQLYHLYFDCMLRELEEQHLVTLMTDFSYDMLQAMREVYAGTPDDSIFSRAAYRNVQFYNIAWHLFTGKPIQSGMGQDLEKREIARVMDAQNSTSELLMDYMGEISYAYSLYRPRGHYSRSDALKRYFRGMMWLQSAPMGMNNADEVNQAVIMAYVLNHNKALQAKYDKLNNLITFLMGQPDDLSMLNVKTEVAKTGIEDLGELLGNDKAMGKIVSTLKEIGDKQTRIRPKFEKTSHNKICVMPQHYQPDAEVLQEMVDYESNPTKRAVPQGLDIFAAMGVSAAEQILLEEEQDWKDYKPALGKMKKRMGEVDWKETIATQWMRTLKTVSEKTDKQPYFMLTSDWDRKNLNAMLASWAELKHDAILYAKQPMGAECGGGGLPEPVVKGYVEPNTSFWKKGIELLDNTANLLKEQKMLTEKIEEATTRIREEAEFLLRVSEKELAGKQLTDEEYDQIKCVGATFENISLNFIRQPDQYLMGWSDVEGADKKVALVADVYTANADNNPNKSILFEAVGDADEIYVVVEIGGYLYLTRGAVLSYREFQQAIDEPRLTDEEWQQMLEKQPRKGVPVWMKPILVPLEKLPEVNEEYFYSSGC